MWVHPYQARVSTIDDMARKLALLVSARPNWPYAFVQFNRDAHHMPLPKEGHLSAMAEGMPSNIPCSMICPIGGPSTSAFRGLSSVPWGIKWVFGPGSNNSAQITIPQYDYTGWWAHPPTRGHLTIHDRWTRVQDPVSQQCFNHYFPHMPCYGASPQGRVKSVWPWRSVNSYHRWLWTPLVKHQGVQSAKDQCPWP